MSNALAATVTGALSQTMNTTINPARTKTDAKPQADIPGRLLDLIQYFLTPEDSSRPMPLRRSRAHKAAKALFWVAASIAVGIILAQLG